MATQASLIPELDDVLSHGSVAKRADTLRRITNLFIDGAGYYSEDHVCLFDEVMTRLLVDVESQALAEVAHRLAPVSNAPPKLIRRLAGDEDIAIAAPVLKRSARLTESDLIAIATTMSPDHLLAISQRHQIGTAVTAILVSRGDRDVVRSLAANTGAAFSEASFDNLVKRAGTDGILAEALGRRPDVPVHLFSRLVVQAKKLVHLRLEAASGPQAQSEIKRLMIAVSNELDTTVAPQRDYRAAQRRVADMRRTGGLDEAQLVTLARAGRFEEMVTALATLCAVPLEVVDRLMASDRTDPVLILCKAVGFEWPTVQAIIAAHPGKGARAQELDEAQRNFARLAQSTAQRVVRFWQIRQPDSEDAALETS